MDGVEALHRLRSIEPNPAVIVFTAFDTDERIMGALKAGAKGYLLKGAPRDEIFRSIRVVSQGGSLLEPVVASRLLHHLANNSPSIEAEIRPIVRLTAREQEVLSLLARGMTNREIADHLVVSERTAKFHVSSIMHKLGAENRTEAVSIAAQANLIEL